MREILVIKVVSLNCARSLISNKIIEIRSISSEKINLSSNIFFLFPKITFLKQLK